MKRYLLSLALFLPTLVEAQKHHEAGISFGVANYYGDLQTKMLPSTDYHPMIGVSYKLFMTPQVGLRFGASYTTISGADSLSDIKAHYLRNLSFASRIIEAHAGVEYNFWPVDRVRSRISPYVFAGVGVFYSNPYTNNQNGDKVYLRPLSTEGQGLPAYPDRKVYSNINVSFPFGAGMKFLVNKTLVVSGEVGLRPTTTDYLDDVSKSYVNLDTLVKYKGMQAAKLSYRGNTASGWDGNYVTYTDKRGDSRSNDWMWFANITISIYFNSGGNSRTYWQTTCPRGRRSSSR
ncbi:DUF6089 family protein [Rurimicrobium arvi]|uniref:type IX secretion system protein PorG n=1 Tax=Rurimicrobium arvi TaxID=2049916 RepID=UPI0031D50522